MKGGNQSFVNCRDCRFRRAPSRPRPFSQGDASTPEGIEIWKRWTEHERDMERTELEMAHSHEPFIFKPKFYSWCERWTEMSQSRWQKDAMGNPVKIYELCVHHNEEHDCPYFEALTDAD